MKLLPDWREVLRKAWSVKLMLLAGVASTVEAAWQAYVHGQTPIIVGVTALVCFGSALARVIAQPSLRGDQQ